MMPVAGVRVRAKCCAQSSGAAHDPSPFTGPLNLKDTVSSLSKVGPALGCCMQYCGTKGDSQHRTMAALDWPFAMQATVLLAVGPRPPLHMPFPGQPGTCSRPSMITRKARRSVLSSAKPPSPGAAVYTVCGCCRIVIDRTKNWDAWRADRWKGKYPVLGISNSK